MKMNKDIYFISAGLGWPRTEDLKQFGDRYIQTEAAEQTALDIAVGLAYAGKLPVIYTITPFLYRGFETIRTYINHERLPVILIGIGRDDDYSKDDGFSHDASDIYYFMDGFSNIAKYYPDTIEEMQKALDEGIKLKKPIFINIKR